tara:strand:- start:205 stop:423 length:219 start_codon:yes stop_codon:yes gene_type:complete
MIVIKDGPAFHKIYADKAFDKWGAPTGEDIRIVEDWNDFAIPNDAEKYDANRSIREHAGHNKMAKVLRLQKF